MKKKYIIALEDRNVWSCGVPAKTLLLSDVSIFGTDLSSVNTGIELTPYTEPDLEQVRKEAYEDGYKTAKVQCNIQVEKDMREVGERHYQKGLSDAWEAARKVVALSTVDRRKVFGSEYMYSILEKHTASEAIEKIRQYELEKKLEQLQEGVEKPIRAEDIMRQYLDTFCKGRSCSGCPLNTSDFTCGRGYHFLTTTPVSDEEVRRAYAKVCKR